MTTLIRCEHDTLHTEVPAKDVATSYSIALIGRVLLKVDSHRGVVFLNPHWIQEITEKSDELHKG